MATPIPAKAVLEFTPRPRTLPASADPRLHGIARGLGLLLETGEDDDLPEELHDLVGQLNLRDDWDGPDRED